MDKPFAITLDIDSSLANHTGTWRSERPVYVDGLPPCNHACPAGEQVQGWLYAAEDGSYETAWRRLVADNPFPAVMGRVCYHPCETACNRAELDTAVGINSVERFLGDEAIRAGLATAGAGRFDRPPSACRGSRTHRTVRGVSPSAAGTRGRDPRSRQRTRRDDALRHPDLPAAAQRPRCGNRPAASSRHHIEAQHSRQRSRPSDARWALLCGVSGHRRPTQPPRLCPGRAGRACPRRALRARRRRQRASGRSSAGPSSSTAAATPRWTRPAPPGGSGQTTPSSCTAVRRRRCPPIPSKSRRPWRRAYSSSGSAPITQVDNGAMTLEKMELDEHGKPQPTGVYEQLAGDAVILALGQDVDRSLLETCRASRSSTGWSASTRP